ncbi:PD-(D/E)XK nuclease family protein [Thiohalobacter sp. IOR34]|uniref:PD-(D/E)XK nuclease family protein n=1 Tax=Thiohalobacter sp. IOR34 TaxID=3057176 RepID=UPI0025B000AE|nr:PD-(D/E)XK nuclease family protein [Thiohalobacter sp. IOR34]WJW74752.1 PD-(D/E)XK nuclease family protein [Thiohalobacter sp. IOR34]
MNPRSAGAIQILPYEQDLLATAALQVVADQAERLPDLSAVSLLLPTGLAAAPLRRELLAAARQAGHAALLGPRIECLRDWVLAAAPDGPRALGKAACELALVEALRGHAGLFGEEDPWHITTPLWRLLQELSLHGGLLPDDPAELAARLASGYGVEDSEALPPALQHEAEIVHRLWQAWNQQLQAEGVTDPAGLYRQALEELGRQGPPGPVYLIGLHDLSAAEWNWLGPWLEAGQARWLLHGNPEYSQGPGAALADLAARDASWRVAEPTDAPYAAFLDALHPRPGETLAHRAAILRQQWPQSPATGRLHVFAADSAEQEARAIELQVRRWLLEDLAPVGVVTEDRRLARRVRALLERAGITLQDSGGWALSTTSAATTLERWLECIEEDFAHQPLLDLLKSPFSFAAEDRDEHLATVYRLEQDIILHENVARGLDRYRHHLEYRRRRLAPGGGEGHYQAILDLLRRLEGAATGLQQLRLGEHPAADFLLALREGLEQLQVWPALEADPAGQRIVQLWEELHSAAREQPLDLDWDGFRTWLGRSLEQGHFQPPADAGPVRLLNLEQAQTQRFAALVIGGCDRDRLPGTPPPSPFFNEAVRAELGLPGWQRQQTLCLYRFRCLLSSAPRLLLSHRREEAGEPVLPSPWLEALEALHRMAWGQGLEDPTLAALVEDPATAVAAPQPAPRPPVPARPAPAIPAALRPRRVSPSSHQRLIDCPYRWFAADCLTLRAPEPVREALQKSDYGERVHRCLEAFHGEVRGLAGPFRGPLDKAHRDLAIGLLERIARQVFAADLEDNFEHRGWLKRWQRLIPAYIDWQIAQQAQWRVVAVEQQREQPLDEGLSLKGRLDRLDRGDDGLCIIDYKTGGLPAQAEVEAGEAVQLPLYAALAGDEPVARVLYLRLDNDKVSAPVELADEKLAELSEAVLRRLRETTTAIDAGARLPAWGDAGTCRHCDMGGLCRREVWCEEEEKVGD